MNKRQVNFKQEGVEFMAGTTATDKNDLDNHRVYSFESLGFSKKYTKKLKPPKRSDNAVLDK
jgi:hypothetical protein